MADLRLKVNPSFFNKSTLRHDLIRPQLLGPSETALGHIQLGLGHEIFLHQFIQPQAPNCQQRLTASDAITQLDMDLLDLPFDSRGDLGHVLEIQRHFAGGRHHFGYRA